MSPIDDLPGLEQHGLDPQELGNQLALKAYSILVGEATRPAVLRPERCSTHNCASWLLRPLSQLFCWWFSPDPSGGVPTPTPIAAIVAGEDVLKPTTGRTQ